jgi:expansin (peptidoglycan-binding protein)
MVMTYIRKPKDITWPYNMVSGIPTYNATGDYGGTLQDPEWRDQEINELIFIQLGLIGINLKDIDLIRLSQTAKQQGE